MPRNESGVVSRATERTMLSTSLDSQVKEEENSQEDNDDQFYVFVFKEKLVIPPGASQKEKNALKAIHRRSEEKARLKFVSERHRKLIRKTILKGSATISHTQIDKLMRRLAKLA